jgi:transposase
VNKDRLYRSLDHLLAHKAALEAHLARRCGELFAVQNEVLLYDVTSTYFEGQAPGNPQAQRGYSRDHRPDCKQVCIALVVTFDGFPLGYEVFAGNGATKPKAKPKADPLAKRLAPPTTTMAC